MEPVPVEFMSQGAFIRGSFFTAIGKTPAATLLHIPGWPGEPDDGFLDLCAMLAEQRINVCMFNPRGLQQSEGIQTFANTLQDIGAGLRWLRQADVQKQFGIDLTKLILAGHSYGGGMAMAYAARDSSIRRLISIAGNDHGEVIREWQRNSVFAEGMRGYLLSTHTPKGLARFDLDANFQELVDHQDIYGLRENAANLADRSILLIGGWEDRVVTIDQFLLPFYRALKSAGATNVTFLVYHTDHDFSNTHQRLASDITEWILRERSD